MAAAVLTGLHTKRCSDCQDDDEDDQGDEAGMQSAVALIGDGKHDKNKDEGANELEWEMGDRISLMPRFRKGGGRLSLHRKSNWLTTCRRAKPEESTTVRYGLTSGRREKHELTG